jgi:DNA-binding cell septation regulator SpoVG
MSEKTTALEYQVTVRAVEPQGNLLGYADLLINKALKITGFKVLSGTNGLFVGNPGVKRADSDEYTDICFAVNAEERERIRDAITEAYIADLKRMRAILGVTDAGLYVEEDELLAAGYDGDGGADEDESDSD